MTLPHLTTGCADDVRLLAELSHEIRTPLTALLGYVELLLDPPWPPGAATEKTHDMLRIVHDSGQHLLELVHSALEWARLDAAGPPTLQVVSPAEICQEAIAWLAPQAESQQVRVCCTMAPDAPQRVMSDPLRMRQILLNVLGNALKFTMRGEVCIDVAGFAHGDNPWLRLAVRDTGVGMSEAQLARLFVPFAPGDAATSGVGLGLAISRRLCESLGGRITAASSLSVGTTLYIELPVGLVEPAPTRTLPSEVSHGPIHQPLAGRRILLADDSWDTRRLVGLVLRQAGAEVSEAVDGHAACQLALDPAHAFDVLLLDMQMPVCDGPAAARRVRLAGCTTPIMALTAATRAEDRAVCLASGCDGFATKPIDRRALIQTICRWITSPPGVIKP